MRSNQARASLGTIVTFFALSTNATLQLVPAEPRSDDGYRAVGLLHDWLTGVRGGERVLEAFSELLPSAPIYTLLHVKGSTSATLEQRAIRTSLLDVLPRIGTYYRRLLPVMPAAAEHMKISEAADLVLSSHHCTIKGVPKPKGSVHVSYIHSPMRYMYDQYDNYFGPQSSLSSRIGGRVFRKYLVDWDLRSNFIVDLFVANSQFVRQRVQKYYGRDAEVVHPFVELDDFAAIRAQPPEKADYYVMVTAFAHNKRVDMAIEAVDVLARGRALIFPGVEDFGITPLEALAAGTPVIAFRAGGVLETLTEDAAVFFDEATPASLMTAIRRFEREPPRPDFSRLERVSRPRFLRQMRALLASARELAR